MFRGITTARGALAAAIYQKTLTTSKDLFEESKAVTLISADTERITNAMKNLHEFWAESIQVVVALWLLQRQLGVAFVVPLIVTTCKYKHMLDTQKPDNISVCRTHCLAFPQCWKLSGQVDVGYRKTYWYVSIAITFRPEVSSQPLGVTSAVLSAMKAIKMSGLTETTFDIIDQLRNNEVSAGSGFRWIMALTGTTGSILPLPLYANTADIPL